MRATWGMAVGSCSARRRCWQPAATAHRLEDDGNGGRGGVLGRSFRRWEEGNSSRARQHASPCRLVAEMRPPHALFRWASSARWLHWLRLVRFPVVGCVEPWVCLSFALSLLLLLLLLLLLVCPAAYPMCFCLLPRVV